METIGKNISILYRQFNMFLNNELEKVDITATELMYLGSLYKKDGITQDELVREYCIDKAATARTIQSMEKKGLVYRKADEVDKRAKRVYLTEKADEYRKLIQDIQKKWIEKINMEIAQDDMEVFLKVLSSVTTRIQEINQE
jgi:DNA-binding MarR family transcriptional regulator